MDLMMSDSAPYEPIDQPLIADPGAWDTWRKQYQPIRNRVKRTKGFDGAIFETHGAEGVFVSEQCAQNPQTVWTLVEQDGGIYIAAGRWLCNRLGYFVTAVPFDSANVPDDLLLEVLDDEEDEEGDDF